MDDKSLKHFLDEYSLAIKSKKEYPNFVLYNLIISLILRNKNKNQENPG